ncbi:MAG: TonB-dependent receptor [Ignavibacteriae bacterium]|nr:TonB-dependent receptor [Ignavibacteriota bacterium]MCB9244250.1 TonB-dependent receptor [Ignavibacteriales bacterium]
MKIVRHLLGVGFLCLFFVGTGFSQTGSITGKVIDGSTSTGLEGAAVSVYSIKDSSSVFSGAETDAGGNFTISGVPYGQYYISVNFIGYSTAVIRGIKVNPKNQTADVGEIKLKSGETVTDEIVVEGEKSEIQFTAEKKVFNVGQDQTTRGGSALDILKNLPSVDVDQDGNVSLRGSEGVRILIDGKPFGLDGPNRPEILRSMLADNIESVELITNPSAKYKAEGVTGIINIITKKSDDSGYNANLNLSLGTGDKYNGGFTGNWKNKDLNIFLDYSYGNRLDTRERSTSREVFFETETPFYNSSSNSRNRNISNSIRGGLDYTIDKLNSITIVNSLRMRTRTDNDTQNSYEYDANKSLVNQFLSTSTENDDDFNYGLGINYYKNFPKKEQAFTGEFELEYQKDKENGNSNDETVFPSGTNPILTMSTQTDKEFDMNLKFDYVHPVGKESKFEAGYDGEYNNENNDQQYENFDYVTNQYLNDTTRTNTFNLKTNIQAGYLLYNSGFGENFTYQLGLRAEYTGYNGELELSNENFDRNFFDLFPSVSIGQKLGKEEELQFSYSRRIRRPRSWNLNPFQRFSGVTDRTIFSGNPDLNPEYTNSFELNFVKFFSSTSIIPGVFYRRTTDAITRVTSFIDSVTTLTTFDNINTEESYGAELLVNSRITPWLSFNGNISYFTMKVTADNIESGLTNENSSFRGRGSLNLRLPDLFNMQVSYFYSGKRTSPQGTVDPFQALNAAISKDFWDGRATVGLNFNDIFNSSKFNVEINDPDYYQTITGKRESQSANLNLTIRLGDIGKKDKKKRSDDNQPNDDGGDFGY